MSLEIQHDPKNEAEITYWNSAGGDRWVERQQSQDIVLGPILQATLSARYSKASVWSISAAVPVRARSRSPSALALPGRCWPLTSQRRCWRTPRSACRQVLRSNSYAPTRRPTRSKRPTFDLLFSRFGVMFFAEPARAFANLRAALKPSGRLAFACWRKFDENPWLQVPLRAALEHVPPLPRPGPEDPGPFSFASEQRVHRILADAGFRSVTLESRDFDLDIACGGGIEEALEAAMALGPTSRALQDQGPETRAAVATSIRRALQPYQRGKQVALAGAIWLVTANNA